MSARALAAATLLAFGACGPASSPESPLMVAAALSLSEVLGELTAEYSRQHAAVRLNLGASNVLARQILEGASVDVFISADDRQMDFLEQAGQLRSDTRVVVTGNQLVIVVPRRESAADLRPPWRGPSPLRSRAIRRVALGDPQAVPAGVYAKAWLIRAGLWRELEPKVVPATSVRSALAAVHTGAVDAAIVYRTDSLVSGRHAVAYEIPPDETPDIWYPAAVLRDSRRKEDARQFVEFLRSERGQMVFVAHGFRRLPRHD